MTEICFLGTGGYVATRKRDNTAFLIDPEEGLVLVDCPGSIIQKIKKLGFDHRKITSILITHIHPDHIYGLPSLIHSLMLDECFIRLYGSEETVNFCKKLLDLFHLQDEKVKTRLDFISLIPEESFQVGGPIRCIPLKVPHSSSSLAFHFYFKNENKELIYSGDTPPNPILFQKAKGIEYLIHDSSAPSRFFEKYPSLHTVHTDSLELGYLSQKADVKCLIPCHFFGGVDCSLTEIEEEIRKNFTGRLIIPEDFGRIIV